MGFTRLGFYPPVDFRSGSTLAPPTTVRVYLRGTATPAQLYADETSTTVLANPLPTGVTAPACGVDVFGNVSFYASMSNEYDISTNGGTFRADLIPSHTDLLAMAPVTAGATGPTLTDTVTGKQYRLTVTNAALVLVDVSVPAPVPAPAPAPGPTPAPTPAPAASVFPSSPFLRPLPAAPVLDPNSGTIAAALYDTSTTSRIVNDPQLWGVAVYTAPAGSPRVTVTVNQAPGWGDNELIHTPTGANVTVPVVPGMKVATGSDKHLIIISPSDDRVYALWSTTVTSGGSAGLITGGTVVNSITYTGADGTALPSGVWAVSTGGNAVDQRSGRLEMITTAGNYTTEAVAQRTDVNLGDGDLVGDVTLPVAGGYGELFFRRNAAQTTGYFLTLGPNSVSIYKKNPDGSNGQMQTQPSAALVAGANAKYRLHLAGSAIKVRFWTGTEPTTWDMSIVDTSWPAAGQVGFGVGADGAPATRVTTWGPANVLTGTTESTSSGTVTALTCDWGGTYQLSGDGVSHRAGPPDGIDNANRPPWTGPYSTSYASGNCANCGMITLAEVAAVNSGNLDALQHALAFSSSRTKATTYRYPATHTDGGGFGGGPVEEGVRVRINPTATAGAGASNMEKAILRALQKFGAYCVDMGGSVLALYAELPYSAADVTTLNNAGIAGYTGLPNIPWGDLQVLRSWNGT